MRMCEGAGGWGVVCCVGGEEGRSAPAAARRTGLASLLLRSYKRNAARLSMERAARECLLRYCVKLTSHCRMYALLRVVGFEKTKSRTRR